MPDGAPELHRYGVDGLVDLDLEVRDGIGHVGSPLDARRVEGLLHCALEYRAAQNRLTDDRVPPGERHAMRVEASLQSAEEERSIPAAAHVVLARPQHLHWAVETLGQLHRLDDEIRLRVAAPAEATPEKSRMQ